MRQERLLGASQFFGRVELKQGLENFVEFLRGVFDIGIREILKENG